MDDVARIDEALLRMRRLWTHAVRPEVLAGDFHGRVELSHVLVVDAVRRGEGSGGEVTVRRVADELDVERSTASRLVDFAARAGWVRTSSSATDARRTVVELTRAGRQLEEHARRFRRDHVARLLGGWSEADVRDLARLLDSFATAAAANPPRAT